MDEPIHLESLRAAIEARRLVTFTYKGLARVAEPHTVGVFRGNRQLLAYQTGGQSSSSRLPEWRRFAVDTIRDLRVIDETFGPRSGHTDAHASWDWIIAFVPSP